MSDTGTFGSTIEWVNFDEEVEAGTVGNYTINIEVGDKNLTPGDNLDVFISLFLYISGESDVSIRSSTSVEATENDSVRGSLSHKFATNSEINTTVEVVSPPSIPTEDENDPFEAGDSIVDQGGLGQYPRFDSPVWMKAEIRYENTGGDPDEVIDTRDLPQSKDDLLPKITAPEEDSASVTFGDPQSGDVGTGESPLVDSFKDSVTFAVREIDWEDDAPFSEAQIVLDEYPNPTISIDSAGRFAKHEIIGGSIVRQKIGEEPINLSIDGVCDGRDANKIDALRDARSGKIFSTRLPGSTDTEGSNENGSSMRVQFGSTSTEPITDGGGADLTTGELLYSFNINAIETTR